MWARESLMPFALHITNREQERACVFINADILLAWNDEQP